MLKKETVLCYNYVYFNIEPFFGFMKINILAILIILIILAAVTESGW